MKHHGISITEIRAKCRKLKIEKDIGKKVRITVYGLRNKTNLYDGVIKATYPNIFTIFDGLSEKSFSYRDVITGDIKIKYE